MNKFTILLGFFLASLNAIPVSAKASEVAPQIIYAEAEKDDPWYPYTYRPLKDSAFAQENYPASVLDKIPSLTRKPINFVPWSFKAGIEGTKDAGKPFKLQDVLVDTVTDEETGSQYYVMYHGTTSDLLDIFTGGASAIRFDLSVNVLLGTGFYLTASKNEAASYACKRWKERKEESLDLEGLLLVVGVLKDDNLKGKYSPDAQLSDENGDPLDKNIFFKRNHKRLNQFNFFSNAAPDLRIFDLILLPAGFGKAKGIADGDGLPEGSEAPKDDPSYRCIDES